MIARKRGDGRETVRTKKNKRCKGDGGTHGTPHAAASHGVGDSLFAPCVVQQQKLQDASFSNENFALFTRCSGTFQILSSLPSEPSGQLHRASAESPSNPNPLNPWV